MDQSKIDQTLSVNPDPIVATLLYRLLRWFVLCSIGVLVFWLCFLVFYALAPFWFLLVG